MLELVVLSRSLEVLHVKSKIVKLILQLYIVIYFGIKILVFVVASPSFFPPLAKARGFQS